MSKGKHLQDFCGINSSITTMCANGSQEGSEKRKNGRNSTWWNIDASDIFRCPTSGSIRGLQRGISLFILWRSHFIDPEFAKKQLLLLNQEWYMHPDGQIPAYEWAFSDVNPPVQAWAAMRVYQIEGAIYKRKDRNFLKRVFQKLCLNFTWWVNRKDADGRNVFEGGFLGLDNIGAFDRDDVPEGAKLRSRLTGRHGWECIASICFNSL